MKIQVFSVHAFVIKPIPLARRVQTYRLYNDLLIPFSELIEEGDDEEEEYEYEEEEEGASAWEDKAVVSDDDDYEDESISELITRAVDVSGIIGDNTDVVFIGGIILAVIIAFGENQNISPTFV